MEEITLKKPHITLGQLLQVADIAASGAESKILVKELNILVNKEKENRRGRKLYANDVVEVERRKFLIK